MEYKGKSVGMILTEILEIYIIEIPKFKQYGEKNDNKSLNEWIKFIESPEVANMGEKGIKKAKEILEEISNDEREIWLAELRQKYIRDPKAIEDAGIDKGIKQGRMEEQTKIIIMMKEEGLDTELISKITGLSEDEINKIG